MALRVAAPDDEIIRIPFDQVDGRTVWRCPVCELYTGSLQLICSQPFCSYIRPDSPLHRPCRYDRCEQPENIQLEGNRCHRFFIPPKKKPRPSREETTSEGNNYLHSASEMAGADESARNNGRVEDGSSGGRKSVPLPQRPLLSHI